MHDDGWIMVEDTYNGCIMVASAHMQCGTYHICMIDRPASQPFDTGRSMHAIDRVFAAHMSLDGPYIL
jgi:hypothetical protein